MSDIQYLLKIDFFVPYILIMVFPFPAPPGSSLPMAPPIQIYIFPLITNKQQRRKERKCAGKSWATRASCSALWIVSNKNLHWELILLPPQHSIHQAFPVLLKLQSLMNTHFHFSVIYAHTQIHRYKHTCVLKDTGILRHMYSHTAILIHRVHRGTHMCAFIKQCIYSSIAHGHTYTHAHTWAYTYTGLHICTCTYMCILRAIHKPLYTDLWCSDFLKLLMVCSVIQHMQSRIQG